MDDPRTSPQNVRASVWFLEEKELYATVKPYALAFTPEAGIPRENIERKEEIVSISDLRNSEESFSLDRNGLMVLNFHDKQAEINWGDETKVEDVHYSKVVSEIESVFPGARCFVSHHQVSSNCCVRSTLSSPGDVSFQVRKRHPKFPFSTGKDYMYGQPLRAAHVGMMLNVSRRYRNTRLAYTC